MSKQRKICDEHRKLNASDFCYFIDNKVKLPKTILFVKEYDVKQNIN